MGTQHAPRPTAWIRRHAHGLSLAVAVAWLAPGLVVALSMARAMGRTDPGLLACIAVACAGLTALLLRRKRRR